MTQIKKADIARPVLPSEDIHVGALGGEVTVRALRLSERAALFRDLKDNAAPEGFLQQLLAATVVDADGEPIFSAQEWDVWATRQPDDFAALYAKAAALSGVNIEVVEKNS